MLVGALYNIVDQFFIGRSVGMYGNAATNVALPLTTVCTALGLLFGVGGASNFNLKLGAGKREEAAKYIGNAITLLVGSGVVLAVFVLVFLKPLMIAFGATDIVLKYALIFAGINCLGFPFLILGTGGSTLVRADGSPKYSMICMLTGAFINLILNPLFVFVMDWGIAGSASATVIGQVVSGQMCIRDRYYSIYQCVHYPSIIKGRCSYIRTMVQRRCGRSEKGYSADSRRYSSAWFYPGFRYGLWSEISNQ